MKEQLKERGVTESKEVTKKPASSKKAEKLKAERRKSSVDSVKLEKEVKVEIARLESGAETQKVALTHSLIHSL